MSTRKRNWLLIIINLFLQEAILGQDCNDPPLCQFAKSLCEEEELIKQTCRKMCGTCQVECAWDPSQPTVYTRASGAPAAFNVSVSGEVLTTADRVTWKLNDTDLSVRRYSSTGVFDETLSNPRGIPSSSIGSHGITIPSVTLSDNGQQIKVISGGCTVNDVSPTIKLQVKCCNLTFYEPVAKASDASCCGYNCVRLFTLNSDRTTVFNATCLENATWDGTVPLPSTTTSGTHCPTIDPIRYGDITTSSPPPYDVGTVAKFSCDVGFKGSGKSRITCLGNGRWSGSVPYCTAFICQRKLKRVEDGRTCKKKCKKDMDCKGSFKKCECDDWCGKSCININAACRDLKAPSNGYIVGSSRTFGHTVTYGCDDGFTLTGPSTRRCRSDKKWSGVTPRCVPFSTCGQTGEDKKNWAYGKVTKGSNAKPGAWPWHVLLMFTGEYSVDQIYNTAGGFGGGSVINDEWILSAAHVFNDVFPRHIEKKSWDNTFLLVMGMTKYPKKGLVIPDRIQIFAPKSVYLHPKFKARSFDYDVALIRIGRRLKPNDNNQLVVDGSKVEEKLIYSKFVRPVCLPCIKGDRLKPVNILKDYNEKECSANEWINDGNSVMVTGFGKLSHGSINLPVNLQEGLLRIEANSKCARSVMEIQQQNGRARFTSRMFCASGVNESAKIDSCQGDSGGPVVKQMNANEDVMYWMQIGIVSWGMGCGGSHPGYYASVPSVMNWIWNTLDRSRRVITCSEKFFPNPHFYNMTSCPPGGISGAKCSIACKRGYRFKNMVRIATASCVLIQSNISHAEWNIRAVPSCEEITCGQLNLTTSRQLVAGSCPTTRKVGSVCRVRCQPKFKFAGTKRNEYDRRCVLNQDGLTASWTPALIPHCEAIHCEQRYLPNRNHYNIISCPSGQSVGSECLVRCKSGYRFNNGSNIWTITCKLQSYFEAEWDIENIPKCEAIHCEQRYLPNRNQYNIMSCPSGELVGSECLVQCKSGYRFNNGRNIWTISCKLQSDFEAEWDIENIPKCEECTWYPSQPTVYTIAPGAPATFNVSVSGEVLTTADRVTWKLNGADLSVGRYSSNGALEEILSNPRGIPSSSTGSHSLTIPSVTLSDNGQDITVISGGCTVNEVSPTITLQVQCCNLTFYEPVAIASDASCCGYNCVRLFTLNSDGTVFNATCLENSTWDATVPSPSTTTSECLVDIMFALDGSGSIYQFDFEKVKRWVIDVARHINASYSNVQFGVMQYSHYFRHRGFDHQPYLRTEIRLGYHTDAEFERSMGDITLHGYKTFTAAALRKVKNDFVNSRNFNKSGNVQVLILVTDGRSNDYSELPKSSQMLRDVGVIPFAMGVGLDQDLHELKIIAGEDHRVFQSPDFSSLQKLNINLERYITCDDAA